MAWTHAATFILSAFLAFVSLSCGVTLADVTNDGWCNRDPNSFHCDVLGSKYPPEPLPSRGVQRAITSLEKQASNAPNNYPAKIIQKKAKGGQTYTTWICATLTTSTISSRGSGTSISTRKFTVILGKPGDQAGHIIAGILGFPGNEKWNIVPISGSLNNGKMSGIEGQIRKMVNDPANSSKGIRVYMRFKYRRNATRPYEIQALVIDSNNKRTYWSMENP